MKRSMLEIKLNGKKKNNWIRTKEKSTICSLSWTLFHMWNNAIKQYITIKEHLLKEMKRDHV